MARDEREPDVPTERPFALIVMAVYALAGIAWLVVAGTLIPYFESQGYVRAGGALVVAGIVFVVLSALVLYFVVARFSRALMDLAAQAEERESLLRSLIDAAPAAINVKDREGRFIYVNRYLARFLGLAPEQIVGTRGEAMRAVPEYDMRRRKQEADILRTGIATGVFEETYDPGGPGHTVWLSSRSPVPGKDGRPAFVVGVSIDVTDRKKAEDEARRSREVLQAVIDAIPAAIAARDRLGRYVFVNRMEAEAIGVAPAKAVGHTLDELMGERAWPWRAAHEQVLATARPAPAHFMTWPRDAPAGQGTTWMTVASPLLDDQGRVTQVVGVRLDVTGQRRLEDQLRQAHKMEAIGQLTGGIVHDFNNMLGVVVGNLELLRLDLKGSPLIALVDSAMAGSSRAADLTRRLLALSRPQAFQARPIDVVDLLQRLRTMLRRTIGADIEVVTEGNAGPWRPVADPSELESALLNLAINARDAMPNGGRLAIRAVPHVEPARPAPAPLERGTYVAITVSDTGIGMPKEVLDRIHEPFFTTKEEGKGTGLGIPMVMAFAKRSGGDLRFDSRPGGGTTVSLILPCVAAETAGDESALGAAESTARGGETVLLVEDDEAMRDLSERLLTGLGYAVRTAVDGPAALAVLESGERVDVLLTGIVMPGGINGPELARRARAGRPGIRVVFMSGYGGGGTERVKAPDPGEAVLQKPFRRADLARAVREALDARGTPPAP